jgi:hypothetical protein
MNTPKPPFSLTAQERDSALWKKLKAEVEHEVDIMRKQNDGDKSADETAKLRGRIAQAKKFLGYGLDVKPTD